MKENYDFIFDGSIKILDKKNSNDEMFLSMEIGEFISIIQHEINEDLDGGKKETKIMMTFPEAKMIHKILSFILKDVLYSDSSFGFYTVETEEE